MFIILVSIVQFTQKVINYLQLVKEFIKARQSFIFLESIQLLVVKVAANWFLIADLQQDFIAIPATFDFIDF